MRAYYTKPDRRFMNEIKILSIRPNNPSVIQIDYTSLQPINHVFKRYITMFRISAHKSFIEKGRHSGNLYVNVAVVMI